MNLGRDPVKEWSMEFNQMGSPNNASAEEENLERKRRGELGERVHVSAGRPRRGDQGGNGRPRGLGGWTGDWRAVA